MLVSISAVSSQELSTTNQELLFVNTYMDSKDLTNHTEAKVMDSIMQVHQIKAYEYHTILKSRLEGSKQTLNSSQLAFIADLTYHENRLKQSKESQLKNMCQVVGLDYEHYKVMLIKYKTDLAYQRSLKPYFDQYLNSKR